MTDLFHQKPYRPNEIPLDDWSVMTISPTERGNSVIIDTPNEKDIWIKSIGDLYDVIKAHKLWFTYAGPALFSALLQGLSDLEIRGLLEERRAKGISVFKSRGYEPPHFSYKQYTLGLVSDRISIRKLRCGEGEVHYIQNLATRIDSKETNWVISYEPTLKELSDEAKILIDFLKEWDMLLSVGDASSARLFFQDVVGVEEMYKVRSMSPEVLAQFQYACYGCTRGEVVFTGTLEDTEAFDMTAAHLEYLAECPGLINAYVAIGKKPYYSPDADYGAHDGRAYIPSDISEIGPLPVLIETIDPALTLFKPSGISIEYPVGGWYPFRNLPKQRVDGLLALSHYGVKVEFTNSIQIFCSEPKYYPYGKYKSLYRAVKKLAHESLYTKNFYVSIVGAMIAMFPNRYKNRIDVMPIYNPIVASRIYAELASDTWYESFLLPEKSRGGVYQDTYLAIGQPKWIPHDKRFRRVHKPDDGENSLMTVMHPLLKDYGDTQELRDRLKKQKDKFGVVSRGRRIIGLTSHLRSGDPLGKSCYFSRKDFERHGVGRQPENNKPKRNAELLEDSFYSHPGSGLSYRRPA